MDNFPINYDRPLCVQVEAGELRGGDGGVVTFPVLEVVHCEPLPLVVLGGGAPHPLRGEVDHGGDVLGVVPVENTDPAVYLDDGQAVVGDVVFLFKTLIDTIIKNNS